ncbi:molybdopterin converting factor subunit 1 [Chelativorans salis]|uniref:Molybdopterin converting factor subunit 1 n=1 Tax=Chelativorans salis TaxID=2978478 RepID=A0ABT2LNA3_9HYPH|nr:molybdopterin converting factor subunit 1 [Chelativorans sp. EGI FJ00035]MCT7375917.1 molybdopterin converting factor subunit 1 [Chelativorans sp. EGI FJ00035]
MKLVYFAWVRERIGKETETVTPPGEVETVADLLAWLKARGDGYAVALEHAEVIRVAVDHEHVDHDAKLPADGEVALFPPMTGG